MNASEAVELLKTLDNKGFILTEEFRQIIELIERQAKVVEAANKFVEGQLYSTAFELLVELEDALAELDALT